jgi:hypothetical protein
MQTQEYPAGEINYANAQLEKMIKAYFTQDDPTGETGTLSRED